MDVSAKEFIFGSLFLLANRLQKLGDTALEEITLKQWFLLIMILNIGKKEPSVTEIADFMGSTRQNVRKMLDVLSTKNYVTLGINERDKRNLTVSLTPQVFQFFTKFEETGAIFLEQLFYGLDDDSLTSTRHTFETIFENLERMKEEYEKCDSHL